jgi:hypothetical protein
LISIKKTDAPTKANADQLSDEFAGVISGRVNAKDPWTFYEQLDQFLGPWGDSGYPLAQGKFYCQLFNAEPALQNNSEARTWVQRTTIKLQEAIRHSIVDLFLRGKLAAITEPQLRSLIVDMHPQIFDETGLALIVSVAPHLLPAVASLPAVEFVPLKGVPRAAWPQVLETLRRLSAGPPSQELVTPVAPTRPGSIQRTEATSSMNALLAEQRQNAWYWSQFSKIHEAIQSGRLNRVAWLDGVSNQLNALNLSNPYWRKVAYELAAEADVQKGEVASAYSIMLKIHPEMRAKIDELDPPWALYILHASACAQ